METTAAQILDGKSVAREIRESLKPRVQALRNQGIVPRLDAIVAAQDPASLAYVEMKHKWASWIGMEGEAYFVTADVSQKDLEAKLDEMNANPAVHGILVQHPLPPHIDEEAVLRHLGPGKDVDGMTPYSLGYLTAFQPGFRCATPLGITKLLDHYGIDCHGKRALVIGRSNILGKPMALMLLEKNATVTIAHRYSHDLPTLCSEADILVSAVGKPDLVMGEWLKPGVVIVDAGYNRLPGQDKDVGDCNFESCSKVASYITPVPGGVGPMTVASLLSNTVDAAEASLKR